MKLEKFNQLLEGLGIEINEDFRNLANHIIYYDVNNIWEFLGLEEVK